MRNIYRAGDLDTVASGAFSTKKVPVSDHIYGVLMKFYKTVTGSFVAMSTAEIIDDVETLFVEIRQLNKGTKEIVKISPETLFKWLDWQNGSKTAYTQEGVLPIPFTRDRLPVFIDEGALGIGVADLDVEFGLRLSVKFKTNAGFLTTKVTVQRDVEEELVMKLGTYPILREDTGEINTTGEKTIDGLPQIQVGAGYLSLHVSEGAAGAYNRIVHVKHGSQKVYENLDETEHDFHAHMAGRKPQASWWSLDFQRNKRWLDIANQKLFEVMVDIETAPGSFMILKDMLYGIKS